MLICAGFLPLLQSADAANLNAGKPASNVILIVIDDLGWRDPGCYGSSYYRTPNIDRLAAEGMRFTDAYAACPVCSPTRAAIMTGKYPARLLLTQWLPSGRWDPARKQLREARYLSNLPLEEVTIAEALRQSGYRTGFIGKWHLRTATYYYPEHQGFDVNIGGRDYGAPGSYFYPFRGTWSIPTTGQTLRKDFPVDGRAGDYLVDRLAEEAVQFIRDSQGQPFFLVLSHYAVHAPLEGQPHLVQRYKAVKKELRQGKPEYAAMIESVDLSVGRVLNTLDELGAADDTLVIFTSDNGGFARATSNAPLRANKGSLYEGGIRVPLIVRHPGSVTPSSECNTPVTSSDLYPTILSATGQSPQPYQHLDGVDLWPVLTGRGKLSREAIYWHYPHYNQHPQSFPGAAVRSGPWKLLERYESDAVELYRLPDDIGETRNLADTQPEVTQRLRTLLRSWREDVRADMMQANPQFTGQ